MVALPGAFVGHCPIPTCPVSAVGFFGPPSRMVRCVGVVGYGRRLPRPSWRRVRGLLLRVRVAKSTTALARQRSRNDCRADSSGDRHAVSPAPFVTEFGNNNVANASARKKKNATPNLQIAQVLRRRASFAKDEQITTRQFKVTTEDNVLGGPLSRGPNYMSLFKRNAREQDSTSFVRMEIPPMIVSLLDELAEQHPEVVRVEEQQRALRLQKPVRQGRSPSPSATAEAHASKRPHSLQDLGISRTRWRYVANFAGLGTMLEFYSLV